MKFGNPGTNLIWLNWLPEFFHPNNIPELRLYLSKIYTAVSGAFLCSAGKTLISPDGITVSGTESLAKSLKCRQDENWATLYQNHFGSQCAPEACRMAPPCQGGAKKGSLWQATLNRVHSTPSALPKWIGGSPYSSLRPSASWQKRPK
jgi:hypothetical protein